MHTSSPIDHIAITGLIANVSALKATSLIFGRGPPSSGNGTTTTTTTIAPLGDAAAPAVSLSNNASALSDEEVTVKKI